MPVLLLFLLLFLTGCTHNNLTDNDIAGTWFNKDGSYIRISSNGRLVGHHVPHRLFSGMEEIKSTVFDFRGGWELDNQLGEVHMHLDSSANVKLAYGCPLYVRRAGFLENGDIDYLYLLEDIETGEAYIFRKADNVQ